jgi:hypothetical protein
MFACKNFLSEHFFRTLSCSYVNTATTYYTRELWLFKQQDRAQLLTLTFDHSKYQLLFTDEPFPQSRAKPLSAVMT